VNRATARFILRSGSAASKGQRHSAIRTEERSDDACPPQAGIWYSRNSLARQGIVSVSLFDYATHQDLGPN
jgi:hypothetical protein